MSINIRLQCHIRCQNSKYLAWLQRNLWRRNNSNLHTEIVYHMSGWHKVKYVLFGNTGAITPIQTVLSSQKVNSPEIISFLVSYMSEKSNKTLDSSQICLFTFIIIRECRRHNSIVRILVEPYLKLIACLGCLQVSWWSTKKQKSYVVLILFFFPLITSLSTIADIVTIFQNGVIAQNIDRIWSVIFLWFQQYLWVLQKFALVGKRFLLPIEVINEVLFY